MTLLIDGHPFHYEMENLCRVFLPYEKITVTSEACEDTILAYTGLMEKEEGIFLTVSLKSGSFQKENSELVRKEEAADERELERRMAVLLFRIFTEYTGFTPKWGILTGVRPIKLLRGIIDDMGQEKGLDYFQSGLLVSKQKTELSLVTMLREEKLLSLSRPDSFSLYIAIPFCPTRCSYCSFVSSSVEKKP
ncbi:MAG TPA: hypothetical protein VHR42_04145 [Clostridia bacterium]|nr:hypothetical protein [Clostridia bacterium]